MNGTYRGKPLNRKEQLGDIHSEERYEYCLAVFQLDGKVPSVRLARRRRQLLSSSVQNHWLLALFCWPQGLESFPYAVKSHCVYHKHTVWGNRNQRRQSSRNPSSLPFPARLVSPFCAAPPSQTKQRATKIDREGATNAPTVVPAARANERPPPRKAADFLGFLVCPSDLAACCILFVNHASSALKYTKSEKNRICLFVFSLSQLCAEKLPLPLFTVPASGRKKKQDAFFAVSSVAQQRMAKKGKVRPSFVFPQRLCLCLLNSLQIALFFALYAVIYP